LVISSATEESVTEQHGFSLDEMAEEQRTAPFPGQD
jgi:hypothetical protein